MITAILGTVLGGILAWCAAMLFARLEKYGVEQNITLSKKGKNE